MSHQFSAMSTENEELHLQNIEEFVMDEDKIVTVTWLSKKLSIPAKEAKRLLEKYVVDHRETCPDELSVTYVVSARSADDSLVVAVVSEKSDETFEKVVDRQIYSVQKNRVVDFVSVGLVDAFDGEDEPIRDALVSRMCRQRTFKQKKAPAVESTTVEKVQPKPKTTSNIINMFNNGTVKSEKPAVVSNGDSNSTPVKKPTKETSVKPTKNGITNFFSRAVQKTNSIEKTIKDEPLDVEDQKKTTKLERVEDIVQSKPEPAPKSSTKKNTIGDKLKSLIDSDSDEDDSSSIVSKSCEIKKENSTPKSKPKTKPAKANGTSNSSRKRTRKDSTKENSNSKRLKITKPNDSDSDDDIFKSEEEQEEDIIDTSRVSEDEKEPEVKVKVLPPKNKRYKFVDKTYTDEEGFVVTRKEKVEESASEEEDQKPVRIEKVEPPAEKKSKKAKSTSNESQDKTANGGKPPPKGKKTPAANQPTLMSFFKKK